MRSTTKKGARTPALIKAKSRVEIAARVHEVLQSAQLVVAMSTASLNAIGVSANEIARAAGYREPLEPEPAIQSTPLTPLTPTGGAARPITLTLRSGGAACLEIEDVALSLSSDEVALLRTICSPSPPRGSGVTVLEALELARMALVTNHNVLATDRPDLPRSPDTGWTTNFLREIAAIDAAVEMQVGSRSRTDLGCGRCSTNQQSGPGIGHSTPVPELPGSRTPDEVRS
nr:hypothetical protein [Variovorax sp. 38R]